MTDSTKTISVDAVPDCCDDSGRKLGVPTAGITKKSVAYCVHFCSNELRMDGILTSIMGEVALGGPISSPTAHIAVLSCVGTYDCGKLQLGLWSSPENSVGQ
jgi:hypothetical protein